MRRLQSLSLLCALAAVAACGSGPSSSSSSEEGGSSSSGGSGSGGGDDGGHGGATGADAPSGQGLFSDPSIPSCMQGFLANTLITGTLAGQAVSIMEGGSSSLTASTYDALASAGTAASGGTIWHPLDLTWQGSLVEGQAATLTGGFLLLTPTDPHGPYYCVTSGDFGAEPLAGDAAVGRLFRFRVTGAREGTVPDGGGAVDCSGAPVSAMLGGCIYRTSTAL